MFAGHADRSACARAAAAPAKTDKAARDAQARRVRHAEPKPVLPAIVHHAGSGEDGGDDDDDGGANAWAITGQR